MTERDYHGLGLVGSWFQSGLNSLLFFSVDATNELQLVDIKLEFRLKVYILVV